VVLRCVQARIFMFVSFILAFAGLLGSGWILFGLYVVPDRAGSLPKEQWPGVALVIQNILIFTRYLPLTLTLSVCACAFFY
jgi:hypothetical protein